MSTMVSESVSLRHAREDDAPALAALRTASMIEMGLLATHDANAFEVRARRDLARMLRDERLVAWVLVANGRLAGCACVVVFERLPYPETSRHAEIAGVYVAPAYRRNGYARELIAEALASARAFGVRRIFIAPTDAMRGFYHTLGFEPCGWLATQTAPRKSGAPPFLERSRC